MPGRAPFKTIKLVLAYDGTYFAGWQRQKAKRTVQAVLEDTLHQITGSRVRVVAAGRTDSGVHAQGQVAHAPLRCALSPKTLHRALNALLPEDIVIRSIRSVPAGFHAQYDAKAKTYRYTIWNRPIRPLFSRNQALHVPQPLDAKAMRKAARLLEGRRDFRAFQSSGRQARSTVRTLHSLKVRTKQGIITIEAEADGFLYHMVRRIAGLLIEIGKGKGPPLIPPTAPARGLCLMKVRYSRGHGILPRPRLLCDRMVP